MNDLASSFRGHLFRDWRALVGHHGFDFAAEALLVELERRLTLPVEMQVRGLSCRVVLLNFD